MAHMPRMWQWRDKGLLGIQAGEGGLGVAFYGEGRWNAGNSALGWVWSPLRAYRL